MGDSVHMPGLNNKLEMPSMTNKKASKTCILATGGKTFSEKTFKHFSLKYTGLGGHSAEQIIFFVLKVATLEMVRRVSRARCPFIWQGLQALQILCYPPFKWIQKWPLLKNLVKGIQKLSRPLLLLSVATAFSDESSQSKKTTASIDDSQTLESLDGQPTPDISMPSRVTTETSEIVVSENWLLTLHKELEKQGIVIPQRLSDEDLHRFYAAANGEFSSLVLSVKKTICWRENYNILSTQELKVWSHLVFWHGCDMELRPCLIIRLGLALLSLTSNDRPRFAQAVVSQIEHGVLHLVNLKDPRITVLMDCEGVSAVRFPMQMMQSFSSLVQDHYPNRLGVLFVLRLAPVVRVKGQTLFQVLKPTTQKKLMVLGEMYQKILAEHIQTVPSFLGGECKCPNCRTLDAGPSLRRIEETTTIASQEVNFSGEDMVREDPYLSDIPLNGDCDQVLRIAIVALLMLWVLIALLAGIYDPDDFSILAPQ